MSLNRDNADAIYHVLSEIAIGAVFVVDDRCHEQIVMMIVNHGTGRDFPPTMFAIVIGITSHQNAKQHLISQDPAVCCRRKGLVCITCHLRLTAFYCHKRLASALPLLHHQTLSGHQ